jgi:PAS domain S-box-containing protein
MVFNTSWSQRLAVVAGAASCILGLVVLMGWAVHSIAIIQISPTLAPMQRSTALGFLLCGLALCLSVFGNRLLVLTILLVPWLIAALTGFEYVSGFDLGIDELLGQGYITVLAPHPGRMSPVTAACFLLITSALAIRCYRVLARFKSAVPGLVGSLVVTVGTVSGLSYLLGQKDAYVWGHFARVALHTRMGFLLLGVGLLALSWKERPHQDRLPTWLPLSVGLAVAVGVLGLWQAFILREETRFALLSSCLLVGGFVVAGLLGLTVYLAQKAWNRNRELLIYRMAFENSFDGIFLTRPDGSIQAVNPSGCRLVGRTEKEICEIGRAGVMDTSDSRFQAFLEQRIQTGETHGELNCRRKDGTLIPVEASSVIFKDTDGRPRTTTALRDISERKRAEQELKQQAALLDLAHDAIFVRDLENKIVFWNPGAEETYGWRSTEAVGKVTYELLRTKFPIPLPEIEAILRSRGFWMGELEHSRRDGTPIVVASRWSLQRDEHGKPLAVLEINRDTTERKRNEEQLRAQAERLSLATRVASIGVWELDLSTNETTWDDTLFEIFGLPKVVPMPLEVWARAVHPDDLAGAEASLNRVVAMKTQDYCEFRIVRPDGSLRTIASAQGAVLDEQGTPARIVGIGMDITERKRMEAQLAATARLSALGMMAGGVAHEINNPLAVIHASASDLLYIIKEEGAAPLKMVTDNAARIRQTADRIAKIVKSLRRIAREGSHDPFFPVHASKVVEDTLELCRAKFRAHAIKLTLPHIGDDVTIQCREVQISQILLNLLTNAFDAVVDHGDEKWVRLDVEHSNGTVVFSVVDSGPGISPRVKARIMEPFFTTKEVGKGTGLGLSLSRTIAEEHGGKLEAIEKNGHTCFALTLPACRNAESKCN